MSPQLQCTPGAEADSRGSRECSEAEAAGAEDRCGRGTGRDTQPPAPGDLAVMSYLKHRTMEFQQNVFRNSQVISIWCMG